MRERMERALRASSADYADIRIEESVSTSVAFRGPDLDHASSSVNRGGIVRALIRGGWGQSVFNDLDRLDERVREACESARLVGQEKTQLAPVAPVVDETLATQQVDFRVVPLARKKAVIEEYNRIILGRHPKIATSSVSYHDRFRKVWFANSEGTFICDERPDAGVSFSATARDGDNVQHGSYNVSGAAGFQIVEGLQQRAEKAANEAVELLAAPPVQGGKYTVIVDPRLAGTFAHEAFGHLSESDFVYENEQMKVLMKLGKRFGPEFLNIIDDGTIPGLRGTHRYDDEGVPTRKNYLIRDGVLVGRLHSRETAAKLGESPTGNARAIAYSYPPIVRMTNTYIDAAGATFDDMLGGVELGVYAVESIGGQTALEMFTFSAKRAYMIRNGKLAELVRDVVLTGNVFETLQNIDMIGDAVVWPIRGGGCGKGGQSPLPVSTGSPHIRVRNMVVGGRQR